MEADTHTLMAAPRGRRLCLEIAKKANPHVAQLALLLGHELDPGQNGPLITWNTSDPSLTEHAPAAATISQITQALGNLDLSSLPQKWIHAGLTETVANARYWQEPDGEDMLAGHAALCDVLEAIAQHVLSSATAQEWEQPRQETQWALDWPTPGSTAAVNQQTSVALAAWTQAARAEEIRALAEQSANPATSFSGTWWSVPQAITHTVGHLPAALDLIEDSFGENAATAIPMRISEKTSSAKTYEVRTADDWVRLCQRFPLDVSASRRHDWYRVTGRSGRWVIPDWEQVASEWDAVHLTTLGYLSAATGALPVDADTATVLAGWNPDTTLWLTDTIHESDEPWQQWHRRYSDDAWVLC